MRHIHHPLLLLETFVDPQHFHGTIYRAANWIILGSTKGFRRASAQGYQPNASPKLVFVYALHTLTTDFCIEAVQEAINRHGKPDIFNTDQSCQFTSFEFTGLLKDNGIQISMDGKGSWRDNVFFERLWRSVKYEEVYLHAYDSVCDAKLGLEKYFMFYNKTDLTRA